MLYPNRFSLFFRYLSLTVTFFIAQNTFAAVPDEVQAIFANSCLTNCHQGNNPSGELSLDDAAISETSLVDVTANCDNNLKLVEPGNPEMSVLYIKLFPNPNCGGVMPAGGAPLLSDNDRNTIFDWIVSIGPAAQFGLVTMEEVAVSVAETDPNVVLTVNRELGTQGQVMVDFAVETVGGDSAVSPTDYIAQTGTLVFEDGETSQQITVLLADDDVFEGSEVFSVTLSNVQGGAVLGGAIQTKVTIVDNEFDNQPGTFFFSKVSYSVDEDATTFDVMIIRSFGAAGQVTVDLSSNEGTASVDSDFQSVSQTLVFDEGVKNQTFAVTVVDDDIEETSENFTLIISNPSNGSILGAPNNVTVTINDNDAPAGGGGNGGGTPDPDPDPDPDPTPEPEEEVEFEVAGSFAALNVLCLLLLLRRRVSK